MAMALAVALVAIAMLFSPLKSAPASQDGGVYRKAVRSAMPGAPPAAPQRLTASPATQTQVQASAFVPAIHISTAILTVVWPAMPRVLLVRRRQEIQTA
jgi:hypothetical protein